MIQQTIKITKREQDDWNHPVPSTDIYTQFELDNYVWPLLDFLANIQGYHPSSLKHTIEDNTLTITRTFDNPEALFALAKAYQESTDPKVLNYKKFIDARLIAKPAEYVGKSGYVDVPQIVPPEGTVPAPTPLF